MFAWIKRFREFHGISAINFESDSIKPVTYKVHVGVGNNGNLVR